MNKQSLIFSQNSKIKPSLPFSIEKSKFLNTCQRCLNPWVVGIFIVVVIRLIIFVPIVGIASLIVALPLIGCTVMCGAMAFMMRGEKHKDK